MVVRLRLSPHRLTPSSRQKVYHIVAISAPKGRDKAPIETLGVYDAVPTHVPVTRPSERSLLDEGKPVETRFIKRIEWDRERVKYWIGTGAQPTRRMAWLLAKVCSTRFGTALAAERRADGVVPPLVTPAGESQSVVRPARPGAVRQEPPTDASDMARSPAWPHFPWLQRPSQGGAHVRRKRLGSIRKDGSRGQCFHSGTNFGERCSVELISHVRLSYPLCATLCSECLASVPAGKENVLSLTPSLDPISRFRVVLYQQLPSVMIYASLRCSIAVGPRRGALNPALTEARGQTQARFTSPFERRVTDKHEKSAFRIEEASKLVCTLATPRTAGLL